MEAQGFGVWLQQQIDARENWKQADLARAAGVETGTVSKWVNGLNRPDPDSCELIGDALGLDALYVLRKAGYLRRQTDPDPEALARLVAMLRRLDLGKPRNVELVQSLLERLIRYDFEDARSQPRQGPDPAVEAVPDADPVEDRDQQQ